jgi:hypothetical protein
LDSLAVIYRIKERYTEAESVLKRSLAILKKAYGPENPDVIAVRRSLVNVYRKMGWEQEAEAFEAKKAEE